LFRGAAIATPDDEFFRQFTGNELRARVRGQRAVCIMNIQITMGPARA
jgi:hypothetical protein